MRGRDRVSRPHQPTRYTPGAGRPHDHQSSTDALRPRRPTAAARERRPGPAKHAHTPARAHVRTPVFHVKHRASRDNPPWARATLPPGWAPYVSRETSRPDVAHMFCPRRFT